MAGLQRDIAFDWRALQKVRQLLGEGWQNKIEPALIESDPEIIAGLLAAGSDKPAEWWLDQSPPLHEARMKLEREITLAFFGPGGADAVDPPRPLTRVARTIATLWKRLTAPGAVSG